jgi:hypothetical protein
LDSGYEIVLRACVASVDVVLDCGGGDFSNQSKGNFLYSTATANSTIDSSTKTMKDGVVDSPPNRNVLHVRVSSPSPLRAKSMTPPCIQGSFGNSRSSWKLYDIPSSSLPSEVINVFF